MLNKAALHLTLSLLLINSCTAQTTQTQDCSYAHTVLASIDQIDGASISSSEKGIDPSSSENVVTHNIEYRNGDIATIEQKYCSMYNFEVTYQIKQLTKESFTAALNNIDRLIPKVEQDYRLVAPLEMIIVREMSEHQLSIESEFTRGLPEMAARSNSSFEHFLRFQPATNDSAAKVTFYFGIGGH